MGNETVDGPGFQLKGSTPERYEQYIAPIMAPFVTALLDAVDLRPGDTVLDLACGTGFAARTAAAQVGPTGRVHGVDAGEGMLAVARARHPRHYPDIEFTLAPADRLPRPDAYFDAVVCQQGAQFFPDLTAALTETARVTRPGGRFAATVWADISRSAYMTAQYETVREYAGPESAAGLRAAFACTADRLTDALRTAGFHDIATREIAFDVPLPAPLADFAAGHLSVLPWGLQIVDARDEKALAEAGRHLAARLTADTAPDGTGAFTFTFASILATATR